MIIPWFERLFQSFLMALMSSGFFMGNIPTQALTTQQIQVFRAEYLNGCLEGIVQAGLDLKVGKDYCNCTLETFLKLPDEKLEALAEMTEEELLQNDDTLQVISLCLSSVTNSDLSN